MSVASSTGACRSMSSTSHFYSVGDSESDSRQSDNDTCEVAASLEQEENADPDQHVQGSKGTSLLKRMGLDSLIGKNRFDRKSRVLSMYQAPNSMLGRFGELGSNQSDTASLMAVTSNIWEGTDFFTPAPSNSAMNGTAIEKASPDRSADSLENDSGTMKEVDAKSGPTESEESDLPLFGNKSASIVSGTEKTTPIETGRTYLSVLSAGAASIFFGATEKTTPPESTESFSAEAASIFSATTERTTQSEKARRGRESTRDLYSPLSVSSAMTENLASRTSAVNSSNSAVKTPVEVQRPGNHLVSKSSLLSRIGDDETSQHDVTYIVPNKNGNDEEKDALENRQARRAAKGKGFFGLRRARATSKSTVMRTVKGVTRLEDLPKSQTTVDANEVTDNHSVIALQDGDGNQPKSTINRGFRRHGSSGSLVENSVVAVEDGDGKKSKSAKKSRRRWPISSSGSLVEKDSVSTIIAKNTKREENEGIEFEACPPTTDASRGGSAFPVVGALARMSSQSGSLEKKPRKEVTFMCLDDHSDAVKKNSAPSVERSVQRSVISVDSPYTLDTVTSSDIRALRHDDEKRDDIGADDFFACEPAPHLQRAHRDRHSYSVPFQEDLPRKSKKSCFDICSRCFREMIVDEILLWENAFNVFARDDTHGTSGTVTVLDTEDVDTLKSDDVSIVQKTDVSGSKSEDADTLNTNTNATLSSEKSEGIGTLKSEDAHIYAVAEDPKEEAKVRKERFLIFCKALCQDLKHTDPPMHARAKAVIQECTNKKKQRVPGFDFESSMRTQLLDSVGESSWRRVERDLHQSMHDTKQLFPSRDLRQKTIYR